MRTRTIKLLFLSTAAVALITSCKHSSGGFDTDSKTGVVYRFIKHDENGTKGADSGYVRVMLAYSQKTKDGKDSTMFDSHKKGDSLGTVMIHLVKTYNGCLEQGLLMLSQGDSAEFQVNADSLYTKTFHYPADKLPPGITGTTIYTFQIKVYSFVSKQEIQDEQMKSRQKYMQKIMARKAMEAPAIADYLKQNHYQNVKPTKDSIFVLEHKVGSGKAIKDGDSVEVGYKGMLLDGTIFDQSDKGPGHKTMKILYSQNAHLIPGWIKILGTLREGDNVKVLIPSAMGYGAQQASQQILPFTPLIFEMQVVSVKENK